MFHAQASNIAGGVTLDLRDLNEITLINGNSDVRLGVGLSWKEVYAQLDPLGLTVAGGRVAGVGVGGFLTGGGLSFLSPKVGFAADTVSKYEVVLANGTLVEATAAQNSDLLRALRGGGNNLGIVTRVTMKTYSQGPLWGGTMMHPTTTLHNHLVAFIDFNKATGYDENASVITSLVYYYGISHTVSTQMVYTGTPPATPASPPPAVFSNFLAVPWVTTNSARVNSMHNLTIEAGANIPGNSRNLWWAQTAVCNLQVLGAAYQIWWDSHATVQNVPGIVWTMTFQPLPPNIYNRNPITNTLGFQSPSRGDKALVIIQLTASWSSSLDDTLVRTKAREMYDSLVSELQSKSATDPWVYLNYAADWQDPISGYGSANVAALKAARTKYDPNGVFTSQVPGGFKIPL
ncbi:putative FAD-binding oxidoreductase [Triangularia setosa]|uniref:FAD-binding oxidoreductase n=1 Tax=Triangularia setosa TaxID=2587417 RepID=A0AAN7A9Y5_9PEZI|nr:putative FAD-binding oxidoreductase [Podospora setosa]